MGIEYTRMQKTTSHHVWKVLLEHVWKLAYLEKKLIVLYDNPK